MTSGDSTRIQAAARRSVSLAWLVGATLLGLIATNAVRAQEPRRGVRPSTEENTRSAADELRDIQQRMRLLQAQDLQRRTSELRRLRELVAEKRALDRTVEALDEEVAKREKLLAEKRAEAKKILDEKKQAEADSRALCTKLDDYCGQLASFITASIPWKQEDRLRSVSLVRELLAKEKASAVMGLSAVSRLQNEEEALGRLVETSTLEVQLGEERMAVRGFHFGLLAVIFANENGDVIGFCQRGETLQDGLENVANMPEAADGYLRAIDILERRRTPALVDLLLPTLPLKKGDGR